MRRVHPCRLSLPALLLMLAGTGAARAEDFTGFYAGVNAGYGWNRDRGREGSAPTPAPGPNTGGKAAPDLPPSAGRAAAAMRPDDKRAGSR